MKKIMSTCLLAAVLLGLAACGGEGAGELELTVFAAASMTETLAEIKTAYEAGCPGVTLRHPACPNPGGGGVRSVYLCRARSDECTGGGGCSGRGQPH